MITISTKVTGLRELRTAMNKLPDAVRGQVILGALRKEARGYRGEVYERAPHEPGGPDMRDAVKVVTVEKGSDSAKVAVTVDERHPHGFHWRFHEWGTKFMSARPTWRPVWDRRADGTMERLKAFFWSRTKSAVRRLARRPKVRAA